MDSQKYALHWFRRDLRLAGNPALHQALKLSQMRMIGIFCFDKEFLGRPDFSPRRFQFFLQTLEALARELKAHGSALIFMDVGPQVAFPKLLKLLKQAPEILSFNRDYEPFAKARDAKFSDWAKNQGLRLVTARDHLLIESHEIIKASKPDEAFKVYTPFSKTWYQTFQQPEIEGRALDQLKGLNYLETWDRKGAVPVDGSLKWSVGDIVPESLLKESQALLQKYAEANAKLFPGTLPKAGSLAAYQALKAFKPKLDAYGDTRDFPTKRGTSGLSIYLKNGSLTLAQIIAYLKLFPHEEKLSVGAKKFLAELVWREFYIYILDRFPEVETQAFQERFRSLPYPNNEGLWQAFLKGETGYPLVDAGIRELLTTGFMHNRVRMVVASFLTKDLLIHWQWGEALFMRELLDGDLAANNGGWQWAASTGVDAQPYFRIFNPYLQSAKFDPDGLYIRKHLAPLAEVPAQRLHGPDLGPIKGYPKPIIEHKLQREAALRLYGELA